MADASDESVVVWYPDTFTSARDTREWSSLCLLHDKVVVFKTIPPDQENDLLDYSVQTGKLSQAEAEGQIDLNHILDELSHHRTIEIITEADIRKLRECQRIREDALEFAAEVGELLAVLRSTHSMSDILADKDAHRIFVDSVHRAMRSCAISKSFNYPFVSNAPDIDSVASYVQSGYISPSAQSLADTLAASAICQLALPDVRAVHAEDIIEARTVLRDELLEFRAGILDLTWLLHQQVTDEDDLTEIRHEADMLVNTKVKASLLSLENRMRQHEKKRIRRLLFGAGRVLVDAAKLFLPGGISEKFIAGGKTLLQVATEIDGNKPPTDQVATYLYKLRRRLKC